MATMQDLNSLFEQEPDGIIKDISPRDEMFTGNPRHYFLVGQSALECLRLTLLAARKSDIRSVLDLPCGHGRVLRSLKAAFPDAELTACDLDRDGVDFCAETFGATPIHSMEDPARIEFDGLFDLIWCGSLFAHLDEERWRQWLDRFASLLEPAGVLVFTSHGRHTAEALRQPEVVRAPSGLPREYGITEGAITALLKRYDTEGFGFAPYENTGDSESQHALHHGC